MALTRSDDRTIDRDQIDRRDLTAAKRRRASRLPLSEPAGADDAEVETGSGQAGRKLSKAQRSALVRIIATHHYVDAVRDVLAEEQPDFPSISDQLIRYYRQQIEADVLLEANVARAQALRSGLANKAVRVRFMIRMVEQWRQVPLVESTRFYDEKGKEVVSYKTRADASREMRELLRQIALELGQLVTPSAATAPAGLEDDEDEAIDADLRSDLIELLSNMAERDGATEAALAAATRPQERE